MGGPAATPPEQELLQYLEECFNMDSPLSLAVLRSLLCKVERGPGASVWSTCSEDGVPLLHLAAMNEATEPADLMEVVAELLNAGAPADKVDADGDTALEAVLQLAADAETEDASSEEAQAANMAAVRALLRHPHLELADKHVFAVCAWLRRHMPESAWQGIRQDLEGKVGTALTNKAWSSEELLAYLEQQGYDKKKGVKAQTVKQFLAQGATPRHSQNGATALLLVVLNPYSSYLELVEIFQAMLQAEPEVAIMRDGFKLSPLQWAADYVNVASQHGLRRPNPAPLLALLPAVLTLPAELDAGEACLRTSPDGRCSPPGDGVPNHFRFLEGHRVLCRVAAPGGAFDWEEGVVVGLRYREACWPQEHPGAPYEVLLDIGLRVFALADNDRVVRAESSGRPQRPSSAQAPAPGQLKPTGGATAKAPNAARFRKQQRADGAWELLDTVSGKARPCSPPSSDDEG